MHRNGSRFPTAFAICLLLLAPAGIGVAGEIHGMLYISVRGAVPAPARAGVEISFEYPGGFTVARTNEFGRYRLFAPDNVEGVLRVQHSEAEYARFPDPVVSFAKPLKYDLLLEIDPERQDYLLLLWNSVTERQFLPEALR